MNEEEIRSRILICEIRERDYREVGNTKTAERYNQEKYKWEELLNKIDPKNYEKLKFYKQGYIRLDEENQQLKEQLHQKADIINEITNYCKFQIEKEQDKFSDLLESEKWLKGRISAFVEVLDMECIRDINKYQKDQENNINLLLNKLQQKEDIINKAIKKCNKEKGRTDFDIFINLNEQLKTLERFAKKIDYNLHPIITEAYKCDIRNSIDDLCKTLRYDVVYKDSIKKILDNKGE